MKFPAYAVLAGGGVKGAMLAGALEAAEQFGASFIGLGGSSAGSLVALLYAAGYHGHELREVVLGTEMSALLDDAGAAVIQTRNDVNQVRKRGMANPRSWPALRRLSRRFASSHLGLYSGSKFTSVVEELVAKKQPNLALQECGFRRFQEVTGRQLKVVCSDITNRKCVVFGQDDEADVLDAVRASSSYPFLFRPIRQRSRVLVDGGLASNLPAFLFKEEQQSTGYPVLTFDLVAQRAHALPEGEPYDLADYVTDLLATALEAGDQMYRETYAGVFHIPLRVPGDVNTLSFALSREQRERLYDSGYRQSTQALQKFEALGLWKLDDPRLPFVPTVPREVIETVLRSLWNDVANAKSSGLVSVSVWLPHGDKLFPAYMLPSQKTPRTSSPESGSFLAEVRKRKELAVIDQTRAGANFNFAVGSISSAWLPILDWKNEAAEGIDELKFLGVLGVEASFHAEEWATASHLQKCQQWANLLGAVLR